MWAAKSRLPRDRLGKVVADLMPIQMAKYVIYVKYVICPPASRGVGRAGIGQRLLTTTLAEGASGR